MTNTETPESTEISIAPEWRPYAGERYAELAQNAVIIPGGDLVKGDDLLGVPFITTAMTFRVGDYMNAATKLRGPYVTVEILTGDERAFTRALKRRKITEDCVIDPEEELVFNEGGTGVYRQAVEVWEKLNWIILPEGGDGGAYGDSRFDAALDKWEITQAGVRAGIEAVFSSEGDPVFRGPIRIHCPRGLRVSEYENDYTKEGRTRYFG